MSSNTEETDPNFKTRLDKATKRMDPWSDNALEWVKMSPATPWILIGVAVALIGFGAWVAW